jgi:hypothetical protein
MDGIKNKTVGCMNDEVLLDFMLFGLHYGCS